MALKDIAAFVKKQKLLRDLFDDDTEEDKKPATTQGRYVMAPRSSGVSAPAAPCACDGSRK